MSLLAWPKESLRSGLNFPFQFYGLFSRIACFISHRLPYPDSVLSFTARSALYACQITSCFMAFIQSLAEYFLLNEAFMDVSGLHHYSSAL